MNIPFQNQEGCIFKTTSCQQKVAQIEISQHSKQEGITHSLT